MKELKTSNIELFALVPLKQEHLANDNRVEIAVRTTIQPLNFKEVQAAVEERDSLRFHCSKLNEAMQAYLTDFKRLRKMLNEIQSQASREDLETGGEEVLKDGVVKKLLSSKRLEEDNKKLRKLLKTQLENSENLRIETQNTVDTLREEFDSLVKEFQSYKSREKRTQD